MTTHAEFRRLVDAELTRRGLRAPYEVIMRVEEALQRSPREIRAAFASNAALRILARRPTIANLVLVAPLERARDVLASESLQPSGALVSELRAMVAAFDGDWPRTDDIGCEAAVFAVRVVCDADRDAPVQLAYLLLDAAADEPFDSPPSLEAPATPGSVAGREARDEVQAETVMLESVVKLLESGAPVGEVTAALRAFSSGAKEIAMTSAGLALFAIRDNGVTRSSRPPDQGPSHD